MKNKIGKKYFSLIELTVVMGILLILIMITFQFFSIFQNIYSLTESRRAIFEEARVALDLISREIEAAYYGNGSAPFWHWKPPSPPEKWGAYRNELLAFVSDSPIPPNSGCSSTLCKVKYQLYYATNHSDDNEGWVRRSVTGNKKTDPNIANKFIANPKWNFLNNFKVGFTTDYTNPLSAFTANSSSSENYQKLIPCTIDLSFSCEANTTPKTVIIPSQITTTAADSYDVRTQLPYFPSFVIVNITLMDSKSWHTWINLQGNNVYHGDFDEPLNSISRNFRINHQITFTKSIYIKKRSGEKGLRSGI